MEKFKDLKTVLDREYEVYKTIDSLLDSERECIKLNDINKLKDVVKKIDNNRMEIEKLEEERKYIIKEIFGDKAVRLKDIINMMDNKEAQELENIGEKLSYIVMRVDKKNKENVEIIRYVMEFDMKILEYFQSQISSATYGRDGKLNREGNVIISKEV